MAPRRLALDRLPLALIGLVLVLAAAVLLVLALDESDPASPHTVVFAVGDGADGSAPAAELASYVVSQNPDRFFYLGDVYDTGTPAEFERNYEPLFGPLADRTDPVIGNHEYGNRERGYYPYWADRRGWDREQAKHRAYVDSESGWQVLAYSSETEPGPEAKWVRAQIEKHAGTCRIAIAHRGRHTVTDEEHGDNPDQEPIWRALTGTTAINLVAHNHIHGRLAPIDGVHVIVSGAGGHVLRSIGPQHHDVAAAGSGVPTATRLVLRPGTAEMTQVDAHGLVRDRETITCRRSGESG